LLNKSNYPALAGFVKSPFIRRSRVVKGEREITKYLLYRRDVRQTDFIIDDEKSTYLLSEEIYLPRF